MTINEMRMPCLFLFFSSFSYCSRVPLQLFHYVYYMYIVQLQLIQYAGVAFIYFISNLVCEYFAFVFCLCIYLFILFVLFVNKIYLFFSALPHSLHWNLFDIVFCIHNQFEQYDRMHAQYFHTSPATFA